MSSRPRPVNRFRQPRPSYSAVKRIRRGRRLQADPAGHKNHRPHFLTASESGQIAHDRLTTDAVADQDGLTIGATDGSAQHRGPVADGRPMRMGHSRDFHDVSPPLKLSFQPGEPTAFRPVVPAVDDNDSFHISNSIWARRRTLAGNTTTDHPARFVPRRARDGSPARRNIILLHPSFSQHQLRLQSVHSTYTPFPLFLSRSSTLSQRH